MRGAFSWFNTVLLLLWIGTLWAPAADKKEKKPKLPKYIRVHVESRHDIKERVLPVTVGRSSPMKFDAEKLPILSELLLESAALLDQPGGFQLQLKFNSQGTKILESYTAAAVGRHLLIMTDFDEEARWIAAPVVRRRIGDGVLAFSPDTTREEAESLVKGLNGELERKRKQWLN